MNDDINDMPDTHAAYADAIYASVATDPRLENKIRELDVTDDSLFSYVMQDREICMEMLHYLIPEWSIADIKYVRVEDDDHDHNHDNVHEDAHTGGVYDADAHTGGTHDADTHTGGTHDADTHTGGAHDADAHTGGAHDADAHTGGTNDADAHTSGMHNADTHTGDGMQTTPYVKQNTSSPIRNTSSTIRNKPETQKVIIGEVDKRSVRLDVYLDDGITIYDIEMQTTKDPHIAQRTRLYQAHLDIGQMERGYAYSRLRPSFVIFICTFDPCGEGLYRYTFENTCREKAGLKLNDEAYKVFFNTNGTQGNIDERLRELLCYINNTKAFPVEATKNSLIKKIEEAVKMAKHDEEWRREYMMSQIREGILKDQYYAKGMEQGKVMGIEQGKVMGIEHGRKEEKRAIAVGMLEKGLSYELITSLTGLEQAEIKKLNQHRHPS